MGLVLNSILSLKTAVDLGTVTSYILYLTNQIAYD